MRNDSKNTPSPRILVVEDDIDIRMVLTDMLKSEGYHVDAIRRDLDPLLTIPEKYYGAAILDLEWPDMSGTSLLKAWKVRRPNLPVIVLTAKCSQKLKQKCLDNGGFRYFFKPFNLNELKKAVREAVGQGLVNEKRMMKNYQ